MFTKKIKNRKVKDIFNDLLGKENARIVLSKIQNEYNKGVRGEELKEFAKRIIDEIPDLKPESTKLMVAVVAIIVGHVR
jgi:hypothetical protein